MAGGQYMFQGLSKMGDGFAAQAEERKKNKEEDRYLTGVLSALDKDNQLDLTTMNLQDKQAAMEVIKQGILQEERDQKAKQTQAQIAASNAQAGAYQAQTARTTEDGRYTDHLRDRAAEAEAAEAGMLKRYSEVGKTQVPSMLNNDAYRRYGELQQNPRLAGAARYYGETGTVPTEEVLDRYLPPSAEQGAFEPQLRELAPGVRVVQTGPKSSQVLSEPRQPTAPADSHMIGEIQKNMNLSYADALLVYSQMKSGMLSPSILRGMSPQGAPPQPGFASPTQAPPVPQF